MKKILILTTAIFFAVSCSDSGRSKVDSSAKVKASEVVKKPTARESERAKIKAAEIEKEKKLTVLRNDSKIYESVSSLKIPNNWETWISDFNDFDSILTDGFKYNWVSGYGSVGEIQALISACKPAFEPFIVDFENVFNSSANAKHGISRDDLNSKLCSPWNYEPHAQKNGFEAAKKNGIASKTASMLKAYNELFVENARNYMSQPENMKAVYNIKKPKFLIIYNAQGSVRQEQFIKTLTLAIKLGEYYQIDCMQEECAKSLADKLTNPDLDHEVHNSIRIKIRNVLNNDVLENSEKESIRNQRHAAEKIYRFYSRRQMEGGDELVAAYIDAAKDLKSAINPAEE